MSPNSNRPLPSPSSIELLSSSGSHRPATMINFLPDNVLLEIFDLYRMDEVGTSYIPWKWHRLAHVCRTWRDIIFASSRRLNLQLLCTRRTPVRKNLGFLPALPIAIHIPGYLKVECSDEDNILAALEYPDRVHVLELGSGVLYSLSKKMATVMQKPFPALAHLRVISTGPTIPVLPDAFLGGCVPCLQKIYLHGIPFPAAPTLLLSARDLVDVDLRDIPPTGYFSPEAMVASLAELSRLKGLTLWFRSPSYPDRTYQPPITRTILPALTRFYFRGLFKYLEDFVAQIDTPQLDCLGIECWYDNNFQISRLCKFINRSEKLNLSRIRRMDLYIRPEHVTIELDHGDQSSFKLSVQDTGISQVLSQISGMLSNVDRLFINTAFKFNKFRKRSELGNGIRWLELLKLFTAVKALSVQDKLTHHVILALKSVAEERAAEVLPALELLCLENRRATSVKRFVAIRRNVGRPIAFVYKGKVFQEKLKLNLSE